MSKVKEFFSGEDRKAIESAIKNAELNTSGEVRVHIEESCKGDVLDQASFIFKKLQMHKTALRNGVLFYLSVKNRKFAVIGDAGINQVVEEGFWDDIKDAMVMQFKEQKFADGLAQGINMAGEKLKKYFPYQSDDVNELSDEISFGK